MTLRLILTRHAKSSWDDPLKEDHSRSLSKRGVGASSAIGGWLAVKKYSPEIVLCSTALRTRETWDLISAELQAKPNVQFEKTLYQASPDIILSVLQKTREATTVMLLAHNPGLAHAADQFAMQPPFHSQFHRYPSGATTVLDFDAESWQDVNWGVGQIADFVVPKDLS